ncbi:CPBP family intramembrane metalloprotease [Candidatus Microgenomates bacterium]|nr:CPBP family intramembrane metalloprotease [Candidatus Microgenomates bacterium]
MEKKPKETNGISIDRLTIVVFLLAVTNISIEFFARRALPENMLSPILNATQIILFFLLPLGIILKSFPRAVIVISLFLLAVFVLHNSYFIIPAFWPVFGAIFYYHRQSSGKFGFSPKKLLSNITLGIFVATIVVSHMLATFYLASFTFPPIVWSNLWVKILPEIAFGVLGMEIFFRGMLFLRLRQKNNFSFLVATIISTTFYLLPFLTNPVYFASRGLLASAIYYVVFEGFVFCYLAERTKSLIPSTVASAIVLVFVNILL